jgi:hypothetical protein
MRGMQGMFRQSSIVLLCKLFDALFYMVECAEFLEERLANQIGHVVIHPRRATWEKIFSSSKMQRLNLSFPNEEYSSLKIVEEHYNSCTAFTAEHLRHTVSSWSLLRLKKAFIS